MEKNLIGVWFDIESWYANYSEVEQTVDLLFPEGANSKNPWAPLLDLERGDLHLSLFQVFI